MSAADIEDFAWAVKTEDIPNVNKFITQLGVNVKDKNGRTPMHWAADYGHASVIELLAKKGADINAKDRFGITPLLAAVYDGRTSAVKALLAHGANKTIKDSDGKTPKECAESDEIRNLL